MNKKKITFYVFLFNMLLRNLIPYFYFQQLENTVVSIILKLGSLFDFVLVLYKFFTKLINIH